MVHRQNYFYLNYSIHQNRRRKDNKMKENITIVLPSFLTFLIFTMTMYKFENYKLAMVGAFYIGICFVAAILNILG